MSAMLPTPAPVLQRSVQTKSTEQVTIPTLDRGKRYTGYVLMPYASHVP